MRKLFKFAHSMNFLNKIFGFEVFGQAIKANLHLQILDNSQNLLPPTTDQLKILVLSPHPDDDVFALGGSIYKHIRSKDKVYVLYLCDGSKGTQEGIRDSSLISKRKKEAENSAKILGINELIYWGYKDGQLETNKTSIKALYFLLEKIKPDIIYLPSLIDDHPDHKTASEILYYALFNLPKELTKMPQLIVMYEVWSPIFPNRIVNISDIMETKKEAIKCHQSQLKSRRYDLAISALNQYRAEANGIKGYAEAFFSCTPKLFNKLFGLIK